MLLKKNQSYEHLLKKVSTVLEEARKSSVRQINSIMIETYWNIGKLIVEEEQKGEMRAQYGKMLLKRLSLDLTKKYKKGYSVDNLELMRKFYSVYSKKLIISETSSRKLQKSQILFKPKLSWSHYCELITIDVANIRSFYEKECIINNWSIRELRRQINSMLYERLLLSKNKKKVMKLSQYGQKIENPEDVIKDPYVLEFLGIPEKSYYTESQLEQRLIDHLQEFILELGKGFTFICRQKRMTIDNEHYYVDLVFYHRILKCLVLIDLKTGVLSHTDVGQMNFYLNYIKDKEMIDGENPPIGIILCTERNKSKIFVRYAIGGLSNKIFVSKYKLYLPTKQQLEDEIKREMGKD